jgi:hypothetical protein
MDSLFFVDSYQMEKFLLMFFFFFFFFFFFLIIIIFIHTPPNQHTMVLILNVPRNLPAVI